MDAFICDAQRTPIGRFGGALSSVRADDLAAAPIAALMARNPDLDWSKIDDVIFGCANQAGEDNRNVARMAALLAGLRDQLLAAATALSAPVGDMFVDGASYGDERRFLLKAPGPVVMLLGPVLRMPEWVQAFSPFHHLPAIPAEDVSIGVSLALLAIATLVSFMGQLAFWRRDIG